MTTLARRFPKLLGNANLEQLNVAIGLLFDYCISHNLVQRTAMIGMMHWCNVGMYFKTSRSGEIYTVSFNEIMKNPLDYQGLFNQVLPNIPISSISIITDDNYDRMGSIICGSDAFYKNVMEGTQSMNTAFISSSKIEFILTANLALIYEPVFAKTIDSSSNFDSKLESCGCKKRRFEDPKPDPEGGECC